MVEHPDECLARLHDGAGRQRAELLVLRCERFLRGRRRPDDHRLLQSLFLSVTERTLFKSCPIKRLSRRSYLARPQTSSF
jgi:hypothetical protein